MDVLEAIAIAAGLIFLSELIVRVVGKYRQSKRVKHPAAGRFCHICGADAEKNESCDAGLHS